MEPARKVLQIVRIALLVSIVCCAFIGERVAQSVAPDRNVYFAITLIAITTVGIIFAVRRLFVLRSEETLVSQPENAAALNRWRAVYLAGFALMLLFGPRRPTA
jgi:ABC-type branched-subunit amino acid transport system permease subunit